MPKPPPDEDEFVDEFSAIRTRKNEFIVTINDASFVFNRDKLARFNQRLTLLMVQANDDHQRATNGQPMSEAGPLSRAR